MPTTADDGQVGRTHHFPVGRAVELDAVERALGSASTSASTVVIEGDSGIGKSSLLRAALARADGPRVLDCAPTEPEGALPFAALVDLLAAIEEPALSCLPAPQRHAVEVALCRKEIDSAGVEPLSVAVGVLGILRELARSEPVLVGVDDLQWLDSASAAALAFALRRLDAEPVSLIATLRTGESPAQDLDAALRSREAERLVLGPFDLEALDELLRTRLDHRFRLPALLELQRISRGNPLQAIEIARAVLRDGVELRPGQPPAVPSDLGALLRGRLARLSPDARRAAMVVAESARPTIAVLAEVCGSESAQRGAQEAEASGIAMMSGDRLAFTHPLIGAALVADADPGERRRLHAQLARAVDDPVEQARHLALATQDADETVGSRIEAAAELAGRRGAPGEAALLAEHALRLTAAHDTAALVRRGLHVGMYHSQAGSFAQARRALEELAARLAPGPERVPLLLAAANAADSDEGPEAGRRGYQRALREAQGDPGAEAAARQALAWQLAATGEASEALGHARACAELAERVPDARVAAGSWAVAAMIPFMCGQGTPPGHFERALALDDQPSMEGVIPSTNVLNPTFMSATHAVWSDEFQRARAQVGALRAWARERHDAPALAHCDWLMALSDLRSGRWEQALACARADELHADRVSDAASEALLIWLTALVKAHVGRVDEARADAQRGLRLADETGHSFARVQCLGVLGFVDLSIGQARAAWQRLAALPPHLTDLGYQDPGFQRLTADAIEAGAAVGAFDDARRLLDVFAQQADRAGSAWGSAAAQRCRGLLLAAEGDVAAGAGALEEAVGRHEGLGQPFELGRALLLLGATARRGKQKATARSALERAQEIFEGLPAPLWADRAGDELGRLGGRPASPLELTETERRVAALVAAGRTNRQAAAELFISPKTVEWNLSKVYRKLDVRSRSELAAIWAEAAAEL